MKGCVDFGRVGMDLIGTLPGIKPIVGSGVSEALPDRHRFQGMTCLGRGTGLSGQRQLTRIGRTRAAPGHFAGVAGAVEMELRPEAAEHYIRRLSEHRTAYDAGLRLAQLIVNSSGFALREGQGDEMLPVTLVDMAKTFEGYAREVPRQELAAVTSLKVPDGKISGKGGAKRELFGRFAAEGSNPYGTSELVSEREERTLTVIDVKHKPAKKIPERSEMDQVMCYGSRRGCDKVMISYPQPVRNQASIWSPGMIGAIQVFRASLDLKAADLTAEERSLATAIPAATCNHGA